jgi:trans-aconitate 2-methyltransferase
MQSWLMQNWDAVQYGKFTEQRMRPGLDLLGRIPTTDPGIVVDLGCGTGSLTQALHQRWPRAQVVGVDASMEMLSAAPQTPGIKWHQGDIEDWQPDEPVDVIYSNAALHWVDNHARLFPRLLRYVKPGGCLAVQMPDNWDQPSHTIPERILESPVWPEAARAALRRHPIAAITEYRRWLGEASSLDLWRTTYVQPLTGVDPVLEWVRGSVLAPVVSAMNARERSSFEATLAEEYRVAYPPEKDDTTLFPFSRLFMVAVK